MAVINDSIFCGHEDITPPLAERFDEFMKADEMSTG
jgi:hypothetical protein